MKLALSALWRQNTVYAKPAVNPLKTKNRQQKRPAQNRASPLISMAERVGFEPTVAINHT